jgi:hypothetical protein
VPKFSAWDVVCVKCGYRTTHTLGQEFYAAEESVARCRSHSCTAGIKTSSNTESIEALNLIFTAEAPNVLYDPGQCPPSPN